MARNEAQIPGLDARSVTFRPTGYLEPKNREKTEDEAARSERNP